MVARCISEKPIEDQFLFVDPKDFKTTYDITVGKEYLIYGLNFNFRNANEKGCHVQYLSDNGHLISAPIILFEIIDDRVSSYWRIKIFPDLITLWPRSFFKEYYHEDLSEDVPEIVQDFKRVRITYGGRV